MREKSAKEKEYKNEKLKQDLYDKKKEEFINNNKRLVKKIKDKEEKKSYLLLKNLQMKIKNENRNKLNLENIKSNTYEVIANSNMDLNKEEKEKLFINDEEDNSDDELFNKKILINKKEKEEKEEIKNLKNNSEKNIENNDNNVNNSRNITNQNDNLSINTSHTNATFEINKLKMNLRPKKKENIYYSSSNIKGINDITEEMKQKEENNNLNNLNQEENIHKKEINRYKDLYPNTPRLENNDFKKDTNPINIYSNNNKKNPIAIHKNIEIPKEISPLMSKNNINKKENKLAHLQDSYNKGKKTARNNSSELIKNKVKINNIINYTENNIQQKNRNQNKNVIKLPSLNISNINTFGINNETNRMTAHFKESKSSNIINNTHLNNNVIILPSINNQRYNFLNQEKLNNIDNNI